MAAALAMCAAQRGQRVLAVEIDTAGALGATLEVAPFGFDPVVVGDGIEALAIDTESALAEYLRLFVRIPFVGRIGPVARLFDYVAQAAPGVREILTLGKICHEARTGPWDLIVVDAPATGHVVEHLTAPQVIGELVRVGMVRDQTAWMREIIEDPSRTGVVIVTTPEETPVNETLELWHRWHDETDVDVAGVVANRVAGEPFAPREHALMQRLENPEVASTLRELIGPGLDAILGAGRLAATRRRTAMEHLSRLRQELPPDELPVLIPEIREVGSTRGLVVEMARHLGDELDVEVPHL